jgi:hypothetical protein
MISYMMMRNIWSLSSRTFSSGMNLQISYVGNKHTLKRFYYYYESSTRIPKIAEFYQKFSVVMPNYLILSVRKHFLKNMKRKKNLLDRKEGLEDKEEGSKQKFSTFLKTTVLRNFNENSVSLSNLSIIQIQKELNFLDMSSIQEKIYNCSYSPTVSVRIFNDSIGKEDKLSKNVSHHGNKVGLEKELLKRYKYKNLDKINKQMLQPISNKNQNSLKILMNKMIFNDMNKNKKPLQLLKEKSNTPIIRIQKIPSATPVNYRPSGFLTSRNENTPSVLKTNFLKENSNNCTMQKHLDKNINSSKPSFKIEIDRKETTMVKNSISIKNIISNIITPRNNEVPVIKKTPTSRQNIDIIPTQTKKVFSQKCSSNNNTVKSPSILNINLNLNLNVNLNMNTNNQKGFSQNFKKKRSENLFITKKNLEKNIEEIQSKSIRAHSKNSEAKFPLTERSKRNSLLKEQSMTVQQGKKLTELKINSGLTLSKPMNNILIPRKSGTNSENKKIVLKKSDPVNVKINLNNKMKVNTEEKFAKYYLNTEPNKDPGFEVCTKNTMKGIKINNFDKIYEFKDSPQKNPYSTNRGSKERIQKILFK